MFTMHCDNGKGEFRSAAIIAALTIQNGVMTTCPPDTPQKNGMAERVWLELVPMAKCLMANIPGDCPPNFWSYDAIKFSCLILNRIQQQSGPPYLVVSTVILLFGRFRG